jgi:hypothetical protein
MIVQLTPETTSLFNQVAQWSHGHGWTASPELEYTGSPDSTEAFEKQGLRIATPEGEVHFEAAGSRPDGTVIVNVFAWPTLVRVRLFHKPGTDRWQPVTDAGLDLRYDWSEKDFVRLTQDMLAA